MPLMNTARHYGAITKAFHWLTALLIFATFPIGYIAHQAPMETGSELAHKAQLFSLHKTLGLAVFVTALLRVIWALIEGAPAPPPGARPKAIFAARLTQAILYGGMLLVPLSGWVHHAATDGFAPIWWPFGQSLPFVPKAAAVATWAGTLHFYAMLTLGAAILAHVAGALKHALIDRDQTLRRMLPGMPDAQGAPLPTNRAPQRGPMLAALGVWALVIALVVSQAAPLPTQRGAAPSLAAQRPVANPTRAADLWEVESGTLHITVTQFGQELQGSFASWQAEITFRDTLVNGRHGRVRVTIDIPSLHLGSVTRQAMGSDYFDAATFPAAIFAADILPADEGYLAQGTLTLRGVEVPLTLPFDLESDGRTARMRGETRVSRLAFGIGANHPEADTLGHEVRISVALSAGRAGA
ncbi:cytochrome b/b6 domain-containing protein [Cognatishimia sp. SS12]|uniref:cytochrome b/b6 domain-containing protein n=1 Tax=Cognatishimia sp. SS12 TaxID=2979465 RepID=UPI0023312546|nr:cytochrome b/b6 domain-containing protein [Cognatishimia sp. SS12]MDC0738502.1 cytochrome b/b6 domain-containing protein [Cognatishimia sp. SS12]